MGLAFLAGALMVIEPTSVIGPQPAYAQAKAKKPRSLFEVLFGKRSSFRKLRQRMERGRRVRTNNRQSSARAAPRAPEPAAIEKSESAAKVLVVGDFMAGGLAWGLQQLYVANPNVIIVDKSKGLSGFVRDDVKDWPGTIGAEIDEVKPVAVVVLLGMNDRQEMRMPDGREKRFTEVWNAEYGKRVTALADTVKEKGVSLIWMGLPPVRSGKMSSDYLVLNEVYRSKTEAVDGTFVDIWDGFADADGKFVSAGPDVSGQIKRLRGSDGINMTRTGKRKLAFYGERAIRRATGIGNQQLLAALPGADAQGTQAPEDGPASSGRTIVVSLAGPAVDGGLVLEGAGDILTDAQASRSVSYELVVNGLLPKSHPGRVDYHSFSGAPEPIDAADGAGGPY